MTRANGCASTCIALVLIGCATATDVDAPIAKDEQALSIVDVHGELAPGDHGREVSSVYRWLRSYGYFPNPELEESFPFWAPIVDKTPRDPAHYGPELEEAVSQYQKYFGLEQNGRVDSATLEMMQRRRCGHPENELALADPKDKWALYVDSNGLPAAIRTQTVTYKITAQPTHAAVNVNATLDSVLGAWSSQMKVTLKRTTTTPTIEMKFYPAASPPAGWQALPDRAIAQNTPPFPALTTRIAFDDDIEWNITPPNDNTYDLYTTLLHEVGHSIGLDHSNTNFRNQLGPPVSQPIMWPVQDDMTKVDSNGAQTGIVRQLQADDRQALAQSYNVWKQVPGAGFLDIAAGGAYGVSTVVWATNYINGGAWLYNGGSNTWTSISDPEIIRAASVAVDDNGNAWFATLPNGDIYSGSVGHWTYRGCCANDIAANGGSVWMISTTSFGSNGDWLVKQYSGSGTTWAAPPQGGFGTRIAVDWLGRPWVVQSNGSVWRLYKSGDHITLDRIFSSDPYAWQLVMQQNAPFKNQAACARDIGAAADASVWIIGCTQLNSNYAIWQWDEQPGMSVNAYAPSEGQFIPTDGYALRITASPDSRPWVVQSPSAGSGAVWRRVPR